MDFEDSLLDFSLICPECGGGNPSDSLNCLVCDKNLEETVAFMEDDSFDLELTSELLIEYRKNFWGTRRTGKVKHYVRGEMENLEFGEKISRFKFDYHGKRIVIPLRTENIEKLQLLLMK